MNTFDNKLQKIIYKNLLRTSVHDIIKNNYEEFLEILNSEYCDENLLMCKNSNSQNVLMYALECKNNIKDIINSKHCTEKVLLDSDKNGANIFMCACLHNSELTKYILNSKYFTEKVMHNTNNNKANPLLYAVHNEQDSLSTQYILESEHCSIYLLQGVHYPFIGACIHNSDSAKLILKSKYYTKKMLSEKNDTDSTPLMYACRNQPKVVEYMLQLDDLTEEDVLYKNKEGMNSVMYLCQYQPEFIHFFERSKYMSAIISDFKRNVGCHLKLYYYYKHYLYYRLCVTSRPIVFEADNVLLNDYDRKDN